ncbi:MAG TPA: monovalent cation/H(+) antiporter subunit G [Gammaproteobacteria bacterium]
MSEITAWVALPAAILLIVAGAVAAIGAFGLLRLPDFFMRLHPPAMSSTLGAGCVLVASILVSSAVEGRPVLHPLLITLFVVMTAPVTAMLLARAAVYRGARRTRERD